MQINLHLLRVFFAVAERRSFSRAAEALFVSQPAVSKAVRELEHQLDLPLLERAASEDISARVGLKRGRLPVGASSTIAGYWLPPYAAEFFRKFPSIELKIGVGNTQMVS